MGALDIITRNQKQQKGQIVTLKNTLYSNKNELDYFYTQHGQINQNVEHQSHILKIHNVLIPSM